MRGSLRFPLFVLIIIVIVFGSIFFIATDSPNDDGNATNKTIKVYDCDVKSYKVNTEIAISDKETGKQFYIVKGRVFTFIEDPLTLYDMNGNKQAYADDTYALISQDTHVIVTDNQCVKMVGNIDVFGNSYDLFFGEEKVAYAEFNGMNTYGTIKNMDGIIIADYSSSLIFNDYVIRVMDDRTFDERVLLMIFASYYSDQHADNS